MSDFDDKPKVSTARLVIWIAAAGVGLYFVISGLIGALS